MIFPKYLIVRRVPSNLMLEVMCQGNDESSVDGYANGINFGFYEKYILCDSTETKESQLASMVIDQWSASHGNRGVPWRIAVNIIAIITKMTHEERDCLLALDD